ncbi:MAG: hypothetical protein HONBIEJF_00790 [Fimbriimonadaceae bacterium]|nr:hypothetical protein [Fimbriimonadaceae bacterium]
MRKIILSFMVAGMIGFTTLAPVSAPAQSLQDIEGQIKRRQKHKNDWRNIAIGSGILGVLGLLNNDKTLTFVGAAGALYSLHRYEQDRKSQSSLNRARATYFSRTHFYRDGVRYNRKTVTKNGKKYYQFVRAKSR